MSAHCSCKLCIFVQERTGVAKSVDVGGVPHVLAAPLLHAYITLEILYTAIERPTR